MKNNAKTENRKALPKFLGMVLAGGLVGGVFGAAMGFLGGTKAPESVVEAVHHGLAVGSPWAIWILTAVLLGYGVVKYRKAKAIYAGWDGEEEETADRAEDACNFVLVATSLTMMVGFFFYGAYGAVEEGGSGFLAVLLGFVANMAGTIILQQKVVDLIKRFNPEKRGSVYDFKFQKTWMASCDENELRQIGQAAMKSFRAVNTVSVAAWLVVVMINIGGLGGGVGVLPVFLVMLIWGVSQMAYLVECIRMSRRK